MTTQTMFKIRSRKTGLFSKGGSDPTWNTTGKVWKRRGDLSSHFTQLTGRGKQIYANADAEVVELETVTIEATSVETYIAEATMRAADRVAAEEARRLVYQRERLERERERITKQLAALGK